MEGGALLVAATGRGRGLAAVDGLRVFVKDFADAVDAGAEVAGLEEVEFFAFGDEEPFDFGVFGVGGPAPGEAVEEVVADVDVGAVLKERINGGTLAEEGGPVKRGGAPVRPGVGAGTFGEEPVYGGCLVVHGGEHEGVGSGVVRVVAQWALGKFIVRAVPGEIGGGLGGEGLVLRPEFFKEVQAAQASGGAEIQRGEGGGGEELGVDSAAVEEGVDERGSALRGLAGVEGGVGAFGEKQGDAVGFGVSGREVKDGFTGGELGVDGEPGVEDGSERGGRGIAGVVKEGIAVGRGADGEEVRVGFEKGDDFRGGVFFDGVKEREEFGLV